MLSEAGDIISSLIHAEIDQLHGDLSMATPSQININQIIPFSESFLYLPPVQFGNTIVQP